MRRGGDVALRARAGAGVAANEESARQVRAEGKLIVRVRVDIKACIVLVWFIDSRRVDDNLLHVRNTVEPATRVAGILAHAPGKRTEIEPAWNYVAQTTADNVVAA